MDLSKTECKTTTSLVIGRKDITKHALIYLKTIFIVTLVIIILRLYGLRHSNSREIVVVSVKSDFQHDNSYSPIYSKSKNELNLFVHDMDSFREKAEQIQMQQIKSQVKYESEPNPQALNLTCPVIKYNFNAIDTDEDGHKTINGHAIKYGKVEILPDSQRFGDKEGVVEFSEDVVLSEGKMVCRNTRKYPDDTTAVAIATTMVFDNRTFIMNNTIKNWSRLRPYVQPVLYLTPSESQDHGLETIRKACRSGWDVYIAPECNPEDFPVLRSMMVDMKHKYNTPWIGYANGDILFEDDLVETLEFFFQHQNKIMTEKRHNQMIVGRRKDAWINRDASVYHPLQVKKIGLKNDFHGTLGFDYFFTMRDGFPWDVIPPFIIGRPVFDNWLVWHAIQKKSAILTIDASFAITAIHQGIAGELTGWKYRKLDQNYNTDMVSPFYVRHGNTDCIPRKLSRLPDGRFQIKKAHIKTEGSKGCKAFLAVVIYEGK